MARSICVYDWKFTICLVFPKTYCWVGSILAHMFSVYWHFMLQWPWYFTEPIVSNVPICNIGSGNGLMPDGNVKNLQCIVLGCWLIIYFSCSAYKNYLYILMSHRTFIGATISYEIYPPNIDATKYSSMNYILTITYTTRYLHMYSTFCQYDTSTGTFTLKLVVKFLTDLYSTLHIIVLKSLWPSGVI